MPTRVLAPSGGNYNQGWHAQAEIAKFFAGTPKWKHPPHEYLAGMELTDWNVERVRAFTLEYGPLAPRHRPGEIPTGGDFDCFKPGDRVWIDTAQFVALQKLLWLAWQGDPGALQDVSGDLASALNLRAGAEGLELEVPDLWALIRLLFLQDHAKGKTKVCTNPDCQKLCFLQARKGQIYCSHECAVLINVRRFRDRNAGRARKSQKQNRRR